MTATGLQVCSPGSRSEPGRRADLIIVLAHNSHSYLPSSAAPDLPLSSIPFDPLSSPAPYPESLSPGANPQPPPSQYSSIDSRTPTIRGDLDLYPHRRRRQHSPVTSDTTAAGTGRYPADRSTTDHFPPDASAIHPHARFEGHSPPSKRRRLANMRLDGVSHTNGFSTPNGSTSSQSRKPLSHSLNGQSTFASNGDSQTNGSVKSSNSLSSYFGHNREEVTRLLIQSLYDLGYSGAAALLSKESGYQLETEAVSMFRSAVLDGRWSDAELILVPSFFTEGGQENPPRNKLVLAENANKNEMLFCLRQQKFLELLEARDLGAALMVLRTELTPLNYDISRLHALSRLVAQYFAFTIADLVVFSCVLRSIYTIKRDGMGQSALLARGYYQNYLVGFLYQAPRMNTHVTEFISPSVMIPDRRLAILLDQIKRNQINECLYHNTAASPSLYCDHMCDRADFPLRPGVELSQHADEVWYCEFSHDGTKLATASRDHCVIIYDTSTFSVLHKLREHEEGVAHASWSPDDTKLITCSQDRGARVWSVEVWVAFWCSSYLLTQIDWSVYFDD